MAIDFSFPEEVTHVVQKVRDFCEQVVQPGEKEIEALRQTTGTLADTSGVEGAAAIGKPGVEFKFEHLARNEVDVAATSVAEGDLDAVRAFLVR